MEENLKWLWAAFSIAWVLHLAYVYTLASRQKRLNEEVENLRAQLEEHDGDS